MKKKAFSFLICSMLIVTGSVLTSCGGSKNSEASEIPENVKVEVSNNQFVGVAEGAIEIVNKNADLNFEAHPSVFENGKPDYTITLPLSIKVVGECPLADLWAIKIDLLDADGAVIETMELKWDVFKKIETELLEGRTGTVFKGDFAFSSRMKYDEAKKLATEVKSIRGGDTPGELKNKRGAGGDGLTVKDANFTGPFADVLKIKDATYHLSTEYSSALDKTMVEIKVDVEVLKQSSKKIDSIYLNFENESGTKVYSLYVLNPSQLTDMINQGEVGKSYLLDFWHYEENTSDLEALKTATSISGGSTTAK